jgi:hypothetical protein
MQAVDVFEVADLPRVTGHHRNKVLAKIGSGSWCPSRFMLNLSPGLLASSSAQVHGCSSPL